MNEAETEQRKVPGFLPRIVSFDLSFMKYSWLEGLRAEGNNNGPCDEFSFRTMNELLTQEPAEEGAEINKMLST